jgi:hypothetical protein
LKWSWDLQASLEAAGGAAAGDLAARLRRYAGGSLAGLFDGPTSVDLGRRLVVFDAALQRARAAPAPVAAGAAPPLPVPTPRTEEPVRAAG